MGREPVTAVLDGNNFIIAAHMNLLHRKIEVAITYISIQRYVQRFFNKLASNNIHITHVCFDGLKEPNNPPFQRPRESARFADKAHEQFTHPDSDHLTLLKL